MGRESLVDHLIAELLDDIVAGRLEPGGSLPAEAELAARFDVSRLTIREAMRKLQAQGIVRTVPGRQRAEPGVAVDRHRCGPAGRRSADRTGGLIHPAAATAADDRDRGLRTRGHPNGRRGSATAGARIGGDACRLCGQRRRGIRGSRHRLPRRHPGFVRQSVRSHPVRSAAGPVEATPHRHLEGPGGPGA